MQGLYGNDESLPTTIFLNKYNYKRYSNDCNDCNHDDCNDNDEIYPPSSLA